MLILLIPFAVPIVIIGFVSLYLFADKRGSQISKARKKKILTWSVVGGIVAGIVTACALAYLIYYSVLCDWGTCPGEKSEVDPRWLAGTREAQFHVGSARAGTMTAEAALDPNHTPEPDVLATVIVHLTLTAEANK